MRLNNGFGATIAVVMLSVGTMAVSLSVFGAAAGYSDAIYKREMRIQSALDASACADTVQLIEEKDAFASGTISLPEFNCSVKL